MSGEHSGGPIVGGNVVKVAFSWWHYAGGIGTLLAILGLIWGVYQWQDEKKHDKMLVEQQRIDAIAAAEAGKADIEIKLPDVDINMDKTIQDVKDLTEKAQAAGGDAITATSEATKRLWNAKKDIFKVPEMFKTKTDELDDCHGLPELAGGPECP